MTARTLVLFVLVGSLSTSIWAQGPVCTQYETWFDSTGSGTGSEPVYFGNNPVANEIMQRYQAQYGGVGPTCSAGWEGVFGVWGGWSGQCHSIGWTCAPPAPPVGGCSSTCTAGQPINLASGNTFIQQTDVRIPGLGHGLTLTRTWNSISQLGALPMFGPNWISTYEEQVFPGSDGTMKYARATGPCGLSRFTETAVVEVSTTKELNRHANSSITLGRYVQTIGCRPARSTIAHRGFGSQASHAVDGNDWDCLNRKQWALNSAVECHPHTVEVVGSNPTAPTISFLGLAGESTLSTQPTTQPTIRPLLDHLGGISSSFRSPSPRAQSSAVVEKVYHRRRSSARFHDARSSV